MKKLSLFLMVIFIFGVVATDYASAEVILFEGIFERGKSIFERGIGDKGTGNKGTGKPESQFGSPFWGSGGEATLEVCNGAEGEKVSSTTIAINGNVVIGSSSFNQNVGCIDATVNLKDGDNTLDVLLKSKPGGKISVVILQVGIPGSGDVCDGDGIYPNKVIEIIPVGIRPYGVSATPDNVYVSNVGDNTVSVISTSDNPAIKIIPVGIMPYGVSATPDNVYVSNVGDGTVSVISISENTVIDTIDVGIRPYGVSATSDFVYVANNDHGTVSVISISENTVIDTISVGAKPAGVSATPDFVYVSNYDDGTVSVISISENTVIETIPVGAMPTGVSATPDNVYVSNYSYDTVSVIGF
jgi:YVTN family beta-propeller protein